MCRSKVCFIWEVVTRILLGWFSNRTATSVYDCARKSNNSLDHLAWPMAWPILGTGGRFQSLPRALPSPNDVPVLLLNQPIVYSGRQDLRFLAFVPFPARPNRKSRSSIFLPSETKRKRLLRTLPKFTFLTLESDVLESAHILSLGCLCFKRKLPEVLTFAEWKAPPGALPFIWK